MRKRMIRTIPWVLLVLWSIMLLGVAGQPPQGIQHIDFNSYRRGADAVAEGSALYTSPQQSQEIWRLFHADEVALQVAQFTGNAAEVVLAQLARPQRPGPYVYPPTLALLIADLHVTPFAWTLLLVMSIWGFGWIWLHKAGRGSWWLLLIIGSWDVLASFVFGNVELLLLGATMLAATLLWQGLMLAAAPVIAFVVLVKPFYGLFFVAFGLFQVVGSKLKWKHAFRTLAITAFLSLVLIAVEVWRWGPALRVETTQYLRSALEYLWFYLPVVEQTPMSSWNRTPMQVLITLGLSPGIAQGVSLGLWGMLLGITLWRVQRASLSFAHAFALAFVLLYLGRPVGWGLPYLAVVVVGAAWPPLQTWQRWSLLGVSVVLLLSHWLAFRLTAIGQSMALITLQTATMPWETLLVLPLSWAILLWTLPLSPMARAAAHVMHTDVPVREMVGSPGYTSNQRPSSSAVSRTS
jgi:hypothetical protein